MGDRLIFGKLPLLKWGDFELCETTSILEYVAVKADEGLVIDNVVTD